DRERLQRDSEPDDHQVQHHAVMVLESHALHGEQRLSRLAGRGGGGAGGGDWNIVGYPCELFGRPACRGAALSVATGGLGGCSDAVYPDPSKWYAVLLGWDCGSLGPSGGGCWR